MNEPLMWLGLLAVFAISFLGNAPIPLPLTPLVLWMGQFHFPVAVVVVGTLGSMLGWICMENMLRRWVHRYPKLTGKIPVAYQLFFLRNTGFWLFMFNALPFPFDFIRFLALLNRYDRKRMLVILTLARLVRNTWLVLIGTALAPHQPVLWGAMAAVMILPLLLGKFMPGLIGSLQRKLESVPADRPIEAAVEHSPEFSVTPRR